LEAARQKNCTDRRKAKRHKPPPIICAQRVFDASQLCNIDTTTGEEKLCNRAYAADGKDNKAPLDISNEERGGEAQ